MIDARSRDLSPRQQKTLDNFRKVFGTPEGRFVMLELCEIAGVDRVDFSLDPHAVQRQIGFREAAMVLREWALTADPNALILALKERASFDASYPVRVDEDEEKD